jgi:hypothetical protein
MSSLEVQEKARIKLMSCDERRRLAATTENPWTLEMLTEIELWDSTPGCIVLPDTIVLRHIVDNPHTPEHVLQIIARSDDKVPYFIRSKAYEKIMKRSLK